MLRHRRSGRRATGKAAAGSSDDFAYCTYLSDLAVDEKHQGKGISRELIRRANESAGLQTTLILLAAPKAMTSYPHIGMTKHESCWIVPRRPRIDARS